MSVTDPLLKELKGHTLLLLEPKTAITDDKDFLVNFCECVERIFRYGILAQFSTFGNYKPPDPWYWLAQMSESKYSPPFSYQSSVEAAKKCPKLRTNQGRVRFVIRSCLSKRCLNVPVQSLIQSGEANIYYSDRSIIGDEILCEIFLSVLKLASRLQFVLDLNNSRFLDDTWLLPVTRRLQFVPCTELGLSLAFVDGKAIAVSVVPNSIASEEDQIEVGDVLDELNSVPIVPSVQGTLSNILRKASGQPVTACVIKAGWRGQIYEPLLPLLRRADVNIAQLQNHISGHTILSNESNCYKDKTSAIYWLGKVSTGNFGDVKQIRQAIDTILKEKQEQVSVTFECQDLGIFIFDCNSHKMIMKHAYVQISSCGSTVNRPDYFAYIAEEKSEDAMDNRFMCYIFQSHDLNKVDTILSSIGQGFKRTHYAV